jgi:hypothetical protein
MGGDSIAVLMITYCAGVPALMLRMGDTTERK